MKEILVLLFVFFTFLLGLFFYTWFRLHEKLHIHAQSEAIDLPKGLKAETQFVMNADGQKIAYWYFPVVDPKAVVILIHGYDNPGGKAQMLGHAEYLHEAGYSTVLIDLRGFGESEGNKVNLGVQEWKDVEAVYNHLTSLEENTGKKIGYMGISMGGVTAIVTSGQTGKGDFVIASVPYANFDSLFHFQINSAGFPPTIFYPFMKLAALIELGKAYEQFTPSAVIGKMKVPILLISAKQDEEVNPQDAKTLFGLANQPKEYWEVESHHDIFQAYPAEFKQKVLQFLQTQ